MDTSDDSDSDWDEGAALVAQAIIGFEEGKYRVQWEGEGDSKKKKHIVKLLIGCTCAPATPRH